MKLFHHPEISSLPERGAYTAVECLCEWRETIKHALGRYAEWAGQPDRVGDVARSARCFYTDSAADLEKLLPFLESDDDHAEAQRVGELRDRLRELFGEDAEATATASAANEAEHLAAEAANLRATIYQQIGTAHVLMRQAGPLPLTGQKRRFVSEGWQCMARTIINTAALPGMDVATIDTLETLIQTADTVRALLPDDFAG